MFRPFFASRELKASQSTLSDPLSAFLFDAQPTLSNINVTAKNAMTCTPVSCAVRAISETVGQLPLHIYQRGKDGTKSRAPDHPAHELVHDLSNEWTPAPAFREQLTRDALLHDGGFAYINRVNDRPVELIRLDPKAVTVKTDEATGEPVYSVREKKNVTRVYDRRDILHIPAPGGESLIKQAREAIGLALVMEKHAARLFGRGARPSGVLTVSGKLDQAAFERLRASWRAAHTGENTGDTAILEQGTTFAPTTLNSVDAQFLELRNFSIAEIARVFRVPPTLLMDFGRATWANSEAMRRDFIDFTLRRWLSAWEGEIRLKLIAPEDRNTYFAEFLLDDFLKGDLATRVDTYAKAIAARILSPNEARAAENRPPYEGGDTFANPNVTSEPPPPAQNDDPARDRDAA